MQKNSIRTSLILTCFIISSFIYVNMMLSTSTRPSTFGTQQFQAQGINPPTMNVITPTNFSVVDSPVQFRVQAIGGDWPVLVVQLYGAFIGWLANLTMVNGTAMDGLYTSSVKLTAGSHSFTIWVYDTHWNPAIDSVMITVANNTPSTVSINSDQTGDNWPMFHGALNHTGAATTIPMQGTGPTWSYSTGSEIWSSPAVSGGFLYVGSDDYNVHCLNAITGAHVWNYTTGWDVYSSPAVAGGYVYVGSCDYKVYCLNASTGARVWSYTTRDAIFSSPAVAGGRVYVGSSDGTVYCLNATTGASVINFTTGDYVGSSPAVASGCVFVGSDDGNVYCFNITTGTQKWYYTTGRMVWSSPAVSGGRVYVGSYDDKIYCLDATTGAFIWSYTAGNSILSSPAISGGRVYVGCDDGKVYSLNATTGAFAWSYTTGDMVHSSPAVSDGRVYVGSWDHKLYCLNASTGALDWCYTTGSEIDYSSPAVVDGHVYVGSWDGKMYCLPMILAIGQTIPTTPRNIHAISGNGQVLLTWLAPASNGGSAITGYNIYRGATSGNDALLTNLGNVTTWMDTNVTNGQTYYYKVSAVNYINEGALSVEMNATPSAVPHNHLPVLALVFSLSNRTFRNPVQLTINITNGDWPVQQAWCVIDQSTIHLLTRINETTTWGLYSVTVNLTAGSHELTFFVNDTYGDTISKNITITVIEIAPSTNPPSIDTAITLIIVIIIAGLSVGGVVPASYNRYKNGIHRRTSPKSKASSYTKSLYEIPSELSLEADKRTRLLNTSIPTSSTEQPLYIEPEVATRCNLHKGLIVGPRYTCKHCGATYCMTCAKQLAETDALCWSCSNALTMNDITLADRPAPSGFTDDRGKISVLKPEVIYKIHELGIKDDVVPDVLELLKDVPREKQVQYLEDIEKENENEDEVGKNA